MFARVGLFFLGLVASATTPDLFPTQVVVYVYGPRENMPPLFVDECPDMQLDWTEEGEGGLGTFEDPAAGLMTVNRTIETIEYASLIRTGLNARGKSNLEAGERCGNIYKLFAPPNSFEYVEVWATRDLLSNIEGDDEDIDRVKTLAIGPGQCSRLCFEKCLIGLPPPCEVVATRWEDDDEFPTTTEAISTSIDTTTDRDEGNTSTTSSTSSDDVSVTMSLPYTTPQAPTMTTYVTVSPWVVGNCTEMNCGNYDFTDDCGTLENPCPIIRRTSVSIPVVDDYYEDGMVTPLNLKKVLECGDVLRMQSSFGLGDVFGIVTHVTNEQSGTLGLFHEGFSHVCRYVCIDIPACVSQLMYCGNPGAHIDEHRCVPCALGVDSAKLGPPNSDDGEDDIDDEDLNCGVCSECKMLAGSVIAQLDLDGGSQTAVQIVGSIELADSDGGAISSLVSFWILGLVLAS